jgi:hypothetical protein
MLVTWAALHLNNPPARCNTHPFPTNCMVRHQRGKPVGASGFDLASMRQRGIHNWRGWVTPRTYTRMGMRSDAETMRRTDIDNELARRFRNDHFHIVLRCFTMGHTEKYLNRHCGQHTMIMRACTQSPKFTTIAKTCCRRAEVLCRGDVPVIKVLCICDRGLHRSVAVATTLQAMYQQQGYNSIGPCNLSRSSWMRGTCDVCMHCKPNKEKDTLIHTLAKSYF